MGYWNKTWRSRIAKKIVDRTIDPIIICHYKNEKIEMIIKRVKITKRAKDYEVLWKASGSDKYTNTGETYRIRAATKLMNQMKINSKYVTFKSKKD